MPKNKNVPVSELSVTNPQALNKFSAESLPKFKSAVITEALCESLKITSAEVIEKLNSIAIGEKEIGVALTKLKTEFSQYAKNNEISSADIKEAFNEYVHISFGLLPARAYDYMTVSEHEIVSKMQMSISSLVELARLSPEVLSKVIEDKGEADLRQLSYREVKALVKSHNQRSLKNERTSKNKKSKLAEQGSISSFDENMENVFREIDRISIPDVPLAKVVSLNSQIAEKVKKENVLSEFRKAFENVVIAYDKNETTAEVDSLIEMIVEWQTRKFQERKGA